MNDLTRNEEFRPPLFCADGYTERGKVPTLGIGRWHAVSWLRVFEPFRIEPCPSCQAGEHR